MTRVFLSHNHADKPFARRLATDLARHGAGVWIDEVEIGIGDSLIERIGHGITTSDFLAVVLSKNSVASRWVTEEVEIALTQQINGGRVKVLPIKLDDCLLPPFLMGKMYCDFSEAALYQGSLRALLGAMGRAPTQAIAPSAERARWYCSYCGWGCVETFNDYLCKACGAVRITQIGSATVTFCAECGEANLLIASHCGACGVRLGYG